jgi:DNA-binding NarL/FixJ family response regulator
VPRSILIVDDNANVRKAVRALLDRHAGWRVCAEASNGNEAISLAQEYTPDLIVMDFAMPVLDGLKASREISKAMPSVPIVLHTQHYFGALVEQARKVGITTVISKSETGEKLIPAIETLLAAESEADSAQQVSASAGTDIGGTATPTAINSTANLSQPVAIAAATAKGVVERDIPLTGIEKPAN